MIPGGTSLSMCWASGSCSRRGLSSTARRCCSTAEDSELVPLDSADWESDLKAWQDECDASRDAAASRELDDTGRLAGKPCSLRWIYVHMIEEYARHNGRADLIREFVDGSVGW
jgi:hypothetical protein